MKELIYHKYIQFDRKQTKVQFKFEYLNIINNNGYGIET